MREADRHLMQLQDQHLTHLNDLVVNTNQGQRNIQNQLAGQRQLLTNFHQQIDYTTARMNTVQRKLAQLLHTSDTGKICSLLMMIAFTICMVLMIIIL